MPKHPSAVRIYISSVVLAAGAILTAVTVTEWRVLLDSIFIVGMVGIIAGLAEHFPIRLHYHVLVSVSAVVYVFSFLAFPLPIALAVTVLGGVVSAVLNATNGHFRWRRTLFNIAQLVLTVAAAACTYGALADVAAPAFSNPDHYYALAIAGAVYFLINTSLVSGVTALIQGMPFVTIWRSNYPGLVLCFGGMLAAGAVTAVLWQERPLMTPLVAVLGLLLHRAMSVPNLTEESRTDAKTGLYNARHFARSLRQEITRAARTGRPLALVMADLDHLREVNNRHGHVAGDAVLRGAAEVIHASVGADGLPARFGGEEFALLLPDTSRERAVQVAERIRQKLAATSFIGPKGESVRVTMSLGVAGFPEDSRTAQGLVGRADAALYRAKSEGRDQVRLVSADDGTKGHLADPLPEG